MGADGSKNSKQPLQPMEGSRYSRWRGFLSTVVVSFSARLCRLYPLRVHSRQMILGTEVPEPDQMPDHEKVRNGEWSLPDLTTMFLPEFPHRNGREHDYFQVLGYIAKGSFGPIIKVKDKQKQNIYAVKVIPKSEVIRLGVVDQSKEEVIVQRQVRHPFVHELQDCWQTQHHLYIMCDYCSTGDLYTYWVMIGQFGEDEVKVFAAELGSALGFLHDIGIIHRDVKMENVLLTDQGHLRLADFGLSRRLERGGRAFTICGTIQYMAPEVLSGGPYSHAADWWSLGILLFALATGKFPVSPEDDHSNMLKKVRCFHYDMPTSFSPPFALLLTELLCKDPSQRLRSLQRFECQTFFRGIPFDSHLLQKNPVESILELRKRPDRAAQAGRGLTPEPFPQFDSDFLIDSTFSASSDTSPTWVKSELLETLIQTSIPHGNVPQREVFV
ncbi:ribosomal protein S6 kinase-related protein [Brachyhypopomus gauderio]|uniref:ribosomal protein S6 kinase-related protein n=1 Tax=Brachyhypopomus gauderio TaxID=698409 RepID=UPI004042390F